MFKIFKKKDKNNKSANNNKLATDANSEVRENSADLATDENRIQPPNQSSDDLVLNEQKPENTDPIIDTKTQVASSSDSNTDNKTLDPAPQSQIITKTFDKLEENQIKPNDELDSKLEKSRNGFGKKMKHLFSFKKAIDDDLFEDIETTLLMADVGANATIEIVDKTSKSVKRRKLSDADAVYTALKSHLQELAQTVEKPLVIDTSKSPFVILIVGVNGVGKTTTIAKLARNFKSQGKSVMLAAGDTFRAAAVEQLKTWGAREDIPVVAQTTGSDSASVIFDAMSSAKAKGIDILIADTAGRLHTQANLMQELGKISRVMKKNDASAPHETMIVVDGGTGQNAISQIKEFHKTTNLTGITITKLDGTAKGGVLFNLAKEFGIPVRYIGVGEKSSDLKPFIAKDFVNALLD